MTLLPADYVLIGLATLLAATGLFRGLSGTLAFVAASAAAITAALVAWPLTAEYTATLWIRICGATLATVLAFGLMRMIVKKFVRKMFAQPSDALFGLIAGGLLAALIVGVWAFSDFHTEYSNLVGMAAARLNRQ